MKIPQSLARVALLPLPLLLASCNRPPLCQDCDGEEVTDHGDDQDPNQDHGGDQGSVPDLPCGADLLTDDLNCGACGNACDVIWPGTDYEAGGCVEGECGPIWTTLFTLPPPPDTLTCEQICALGDLECAPRGCSGMTGFVCVVIGDFGSQCDLGNPLNKAYFEMTGDCDDVAPYPNNLDLGFHPYLDCCCERP